MCKKFLVSGHVQGVFFRASTRDQAVSLKLRGHACNLPDGSVEVVACGAESDIGLLADWLRKGPRMATVSSVEAIDIDCGQPVGFSTSQTGGVRRETT
jgi:acylphosphatase